MLLRRTHVKYYYNNRDDNDDVDDYNELQRRVQAPAETNTLVAYSTVGLVALTLTLTS